MENGALSIRMGNHANKNIEGKVITLQPLVVTGSPASPMSWRCGMREVPTGMEGAGPNHTDIENKYLPSACRGE